MSIDLENNLDVIRLNNMIFYGYHGVKDAEKHYGQRFEVDAELFLDLHKAGQSDQLSDTVDYSNVYQIIEEINRKFSQKLHDQHPGDWERHKRMSIIKDGMINMAWLAIEG